MNEINEGTSCVISIDFKDEDGIAVVPTAGRYRIDDAESEHTVKHWTAFVPVTSNIMLYIDHNDNRLIAQEHKRETRIVTVEYTYGARSMIGTGEARFTINGLRYY
jgi:hypothetical protein